MDNKEFAKAIQDSLNDPTGVIRYLEVKEEVDDKINEERHNEAMQLNKKIYYVAIASLLVSAISLLIGVISLIRL